jgi:hypothetical protein
MRRLVLLAALACTACSNAPEVILIRGGRMQVSAVNKFGNYCYVAWYQGIDHVILLENGTAHDYPFEYKWEPLKFSERSDRAEFWKRLGCEEPKQ